MNKSKYGTGGFTAIEPTGKISFVGILFSSAAPPFYI
jgi:hypothetical protein